MSSNLTYMFCLSVFCLFIRLFMLCCFALLTEMACQSNHCTCDLSYPVHSAGMRALCRSAHHGFSRGGKVVVPGVCLLCGYHFNYSGFRRLRCRYTAAHRSNTLHFLAWPAGVCTGSLKGKMKKENFSFPLDTNFTIKANDNWTNNTFFLFR